MKCPQCGFENPADTQVCKDCGLHVFSFFPETQTIRTLPQDSTLGEIISERYKLLEELGKGGMGVVYKAEQIKPIKRQVALKIIKLGMDTHQVVARFEAERQALAVMDHPNIAKVFDAGATEQGRPYIVMELVHGVPINTYCDKHKLSTKERLYLFLPVCQAVQHAHQKGVIHRDLKPSNILVAIQEDQPVPKVIDFGIAKATGKSLTERTLYTEKGQLIGTPEYMSPEQAEMSELDIDTRTDIYSLGVILYELLAGVLPFDPETLRAASLAEIQRIIREKEPPKISTRLSSLGDTGPIIADFRNTDPGSLHRELKGDLDWITMKAMAKDRVHRYASASELDADLMRYLNHDPVAAGPPSVVYRAKKYVKRHKLGVAAAAFISLALIAGIIGTGIGLLKATKAEKKAREEAQIAQQVSNFLVELFRVSDPGEARGNTITAREILEKGAAAVEKDLAAQPRIQSRLMQTIGTVYRNLGLYSQAEPVLEKTLAIKRDVYGEEHFEVAAALHSLAILYDTQGKYQEAVSFFQQSLAIKEKVFGPDHPEVAKSLNSIAVVFYNQGKYDEAEPFFRQALAVKEKTLGPDSAEVGNSLTNLGIMLHRLGRLEEAEPICIRALELSEKLNGSDHPDVAAALNNLGSVYEDMQRQGEAEPLYERSLAIWEKSLGPEHTDVGIALHNLANLYRNQGKYAQAEQHYIRSQAIFKKAFGNDHPYVAYSFREQANLFREKGEYAKAEGLYKQALIIFEAKLGPEHPNVAETLHNYALLLRKVDRIQEAEKLEARVKALGVTIN